MLLLEQAMFSSTRSVCFRTGACVEERLALGGGEQQPYRTFLTEKMSEKKRKKSYGTRDSEGYYR